MSTSKYKNIDRHYKFIRSMKEENVINYFGEWLEEEKDFIKYSEKDINAMPVLFELPTYAELVEIVRKCRD